MMRVVFCGTGEIGVPALRALIDSEKYHVIAVITQPDKPAGRDLKPRASAIKQLAIERGIPVSQPARLREAEAIAALRTLEPDLMIVAAYGQILPRPVLDLPRLGCFNLHASLLPRHRGASPIHAAILAGDPVTGMTVMYMDEGLDTGDMLLAEAIPIGPDDTAGILHDRLADLAAPCLLRALDLLAAGQAPRTPQDVVLATHAPKLTKANGLLDWREPASSLALRVRAMSPWPGAHTLLGGNVLKIHAASVAAASGSPGTILQADQSGFLIATGEKSLLLESIQLEGRKRLTAAEFLRGFPLEKGSSIG